jgi:hypothetical protein
VRFRDWAKADQRYATLDLRETCIVTLPQPIIVAMLSERGLRLGNAVIDVGPESGFFPDIVMAGAKPLHGLRRIGIVGSEARVFARNMGLSLLVRAGNPIGIASVGDLSRPDIHVVMASASEPGARGLYQQALEALIGKDAVQVVVAREAVTFDGRLGIQHRDVLEALAKNHANVGIIFHHLARYFERT